MARFIDITGQRFNALTVLEYIGNRRWRCRCDCGQETVVFSTNIRRGHTTSCGCAWLKSITKHGESGTVEHKTWRDIIRRCTDPDCPGWPGYGGRGITVCDRWQGSDGFDYFLKDMGRRPDGRMSIDRIDNDGPYSPENCRWANYMVQENNSRNNRRLSYGGRTQTISQWTRELGFPATLLYQRISRKWSVERALTTPVRNYT
jgi:hypothetical protein